VKEFPLVAVPHPLLLIRHGETVWNRSGRLQGSQNSPLTETGRKQARQLGRDLAVLREGLGPHRVFCSPLGRAQETSRLALGDEAFVTDARLAEIGCGDWEGTTDAERRLLAPRISAIHNEEFDRYTNAPGGEGLAALVRRLAAFLNDLDGPAVIFSHMVALTTLRAMTSGGHPVLSTRMAPKQGEILRIAPQERV